MRLIDADALQMVLLPITFSLEREYGNLGGAVSGCMKHIDNAPTVDAVKVVRCKDCNNLVNTTINANCFLICDISDMEIAPEDFCSHGERREE